MAQQYGLQPKMSLKGTGRARVTPELMNAIKKIESGGNPNARKGSYKGLYQLSDSEFERLGGRGNIFDPQENTRIAMLKLQQEADQVAKKLGRDLTPGEIYLVHQQGVGGAYEHLSNPNRPAWQSMHATGEGSKKGEGWSRLAIWGNVPDKDKARYGSVDNLTSGEFTRMWDARVMRGGGGGGEAEPLDPTPNVGSGESDYAVDPTPNVGSGAGDYATPESAGGGPPTQGALADAVAPPEQKKKDYREAAGEVLGDIGKLYAEGPVARNAARASGPTTVPAAALPVAPGPMSMVDPRMIEMQRNQLAMALQRLNSGKLY